MVAGLLQPFPKQRLTAADALEHAWLTGCQTHDAMTLHHVHKRLQNFTASNQKRTETCAHRPLAHHRPFSAEKTGRRTVGETAVRYRANGAYRYDNSSTCAKFGRWLSP